jgi:hypothetical protein
MVLSYSLGLPAGSGDGKDAACFAQWGFPDCRKDQRQRIWLNARPLRNTATPFPTPPH